MDIQVQKLITLGPLGGGWDKLKPQQLLIHWAESSRVFLESGQTASPHASVLPEALATIATTYSCHHVSSLYQLYRS